MYPDGSFFKCGVGFLAWALWGYIPIHDSAGTQSDLFGSAKINASFGRMIMLSTQMRKLLIEQSSAIVNNRRGKKRHITDKEKQQRDNNMQTLHPSTCLLPPPFDTKTILAKMLQYLNTDSLEKERQKNVQLMIRSNSR